MLRQSLQHLACNVGQSCCHPTIMTLSTSPPTTLPMLMLYLGFHLSSNVMQALRAQFFMLQPSKSHDTPSRPIRLLEIQLMTRLSQRYCLLHTMVGTFRNAMIQISSPTSYNVMNSQLNRVALFGDWEYHPSQPERTNSEGAPVVSSGSGQNEVHGSEPCVVAQVRCRPWADYLCMPAVFQNTECTTCDTPLPMGMALWPLKESQCRFCYFWRETLPYPGRCVLSKWPEVAGPMRSTDAAATISVLTNLFTRYGFPEQVGSDDRPPFQSKEYGDFLKLNSIQCTLVSPYHSTANGQ